MDARIPVAELAAILRSVPGDEWDVFAEQFEAATRDLTRPLGRSLLSFAVLEALERPHVDPADVLAVFDDAIRLAGSPAASSVPITARLAALPGKADD